MLERIMRQVREKIRRRQYVMTLHAEEEMNEDGLTIHDVESAILAGEIRERQRDQVRGEWKYCIRGETQDDKEVEVVTKMGPTGKLVIITV